MNISKSKVDQLTLGYKEFGGGDGVIEITAWGNFEGHTIAIDRKDANICFSLTHADWDALVLAMSAMSVDSPTGEEIK